MEAVMSDDAKAGFLERVLTFRVTFVPFVPGIVTGLIVTAIITCA
jgi:hypothetical protein